MSHPDHALCDAALHRLPQDYQPWGDDDRGANREWGPDCSMGCKWARWLEGDLSLDWCVCMSPVSHRRGLLTFEHQGCRHAEIEWDE